MVLSELCIDSEGQLFLTLDGQKILCLGMNYSVFTGVQLFIAITPVKLVSEQNKK